MKFVSLGSRRFLLVLAALVGAMLYVHALGKLNAVKRSAPVEEMRVALPRIVQVMATAGDRHLAANVAIFRALVASIEGLTPDQYRIQAIVQMDGAVLNPAHQDNYFVAGAILPWNGELDAAQFILRKAAEARPFDIWPAYWNGFYEWHMRKRPLEGAKWLEYAAARTSDERYRMALRELGANWTAMHEDTNLAIRLLKSMAESTNERSFRRNLLLRVQRLEGLIALRAAAVAYRERFGRPATSLDQLVKSGLIAAIPEDPFKVGYALDPEGNPVFKSALKRLAQSKSIQKQ